MNVRQVAFLLIASVGLLSFSTVQAQQVSIKGPKNASAQMSGNTYGPITPTDTLWRIASRYRTNPELSIYQVMQAIYELNPEAFENKNFNYLVDGAILNLPSERYIRRINIVQARDKAEADEAIWQAAGGKAVPQELQVEKVENAASKEDLSETKQIIEDKLTRLDAEQNRQFTAIRQQFAESITSVQSLLDENRKLIDRLDGVDQEISSLRGRVDDELQTQMDQMLALQNELLSISKEADAQRRAELEKDNFAWLSDPIFLIALSALLTISLLGYFAMWMIRRNKSSGSQDMEPSAELSSAMIEQSDEMDDLADALTNELSSGLDETEDEDDLFGDDDLLDDVLSDELQESLDEAIDEEFESFDDLDEESLDPIIEEATEALEEEGEGLLAQDDLDSLFDEDEEGLLAEVEGEGDLESLSEDDEFDLADSADETLDELLDSDDDELLAEEAPAVEDVDSSEVAQQQENEVEPEPVEEVVDSKSVDSGSDMEELPVPESSKQPKPLVDDEQEKPEISIDELLEQPEKELPEVVQEADSQELDEQMLQNLDKEIENQNRQLDVLTDELLNEIEQLEQMGGMLDEDEDDTESSADTGDTQHAIQQLDSVSADLEEDIDDSLIDDSSLEGEESEVPSVVQDDNTDSGELNDSEEQREIDIDSVLEESLGEQQAAPIDAQQQDDTDDAAEQPVALDSDIQEKSADELLAELESGDLQVQDDVEQIVDPDTAELPQSDQATDSELDQALQEFENEFASEESGDSGEFDSETLPDVEQDLSTVSEQQEEPIDADLAEIDDELLDEPEELISATEQQDDQELPAVDELPQDQESQTQPASGENDDTDLAPVDVPSLEDYDSLSIEDSEFNDADLEEALKEFDQQIPDSDEETVTSSTEETSTDLDDLPGLGDWLSESKGEESHAIDELENASFEEILDSIEDEDEEEIIEQQLSSENPDLDIDALLSDADLEHIGESPEALKDAQSDIKTDDESEFLDVDALLNDSSEDDGPSAAEKDLDLASALESYVGETDGEMIDVDGDNGIGAKLDLAQAYIETDDLTEARTLLLDVLENGNDEQQQEAKELLDNIDQSLG